MNIIPNTNRLLLELVKVDTENTKSAGGLLLPSKAVENKNICKVLAVADRYYLLDGVSADYYVYRIDDTVVIGEYAGVRFTYQNKEYIVIEKKDILAQILEEVEDIPF